MDKWVYLFNAGKTDGNMNMKEVLGGKGANLAEMSSLGLPVPPGLTITTSACCDYYKNGEKVNTQVKAQVLEGIVALENSTHKKYGDSTNPLLFSVRSGAKESMPGMMDTVLNLGLNDRTVEGLGKMTNNEWFAWDSYRRFIQMFSNVVLGMNASIFEHTLEDLKDARNVKNDTDLSVDDLKELVGVYKNLLLQESGISFPQDPNEQLWSAIDAVFRSWNTPRAKRYRDINGLSHGSGTAVNLQVMVFGNMGEDSGTGVCFTRDPSTGEKRFFGEFLINAQGEDVVAGIRTPGPVNEGSKTTVNQEASTLEELMPNIYRELVETYKKLEKHYKDMQDIEFTFEKKKLYLLQTRSGKRTAQAALKIAVDLVQEGLIGEKEAILRIRPEDLNQLLHPGLDPEAEKKVIARGLPASPGAASGSIVFDSERAQLLHEKGDKVLLVRMETSPEDIAGMVAAEGILTARGGMTSHAAVVARGMGTPCVAGCSTLTINEAEKTLRVRDKVYTEGDFLTIDGATGEVMEGKVKTVEAQMSGDFEKFMVWADNNRRLKIRTNADNPRDAKMAIQFGAEGIGLCRTEHMFFDPERILAVREMIFAETFEMRNRALDKLLPFQRDDFIGLFKTMKGRPVNIRLLDPPLHEFLPTKHEERRELAEVLNIDVKRVEERGIELNEFNPMLGHRGCRLGVTYPEIYLMQVRAIVEAALQVIDDGEEVNPEIMIPLVGIDLELSVIKNKAIQLIDSIFKGENKSFQYKIGTMIELPRAALTADKIADHADFFSFGTNDLTQTTFGLSRDDGSKFLPDYLGQGILDVDPFVRLDCDGVGQLIEMATTKGKKINPDIHVGICGEHGGEPNSINFCHNIGLDYVSCSPFRVPVARLAAAQAALSAQ